MEDTLANPKIHEMGQSIYDIYPAHRYKGIVFPLVLHELLDEAEKQGNSSVVSWSQDGLSFKVHDRKKFTKILLPNYFLMTKYQSFSRQLQLWGFSFCRKAGPKKGHCKSISEIV